MPANQPIVSTRLPGGHRFEAMLGKTVIESGVSVSIRIKRNFRAGLDTFGVSSNARHLLAGRLNSPVSSPGIRSLAGVPGDVAAWLAQSVAEGRNILISGGTSSGKTTLLNALVQSIPEDKRVLCVEDTREVDLPHIKNKNFYVVSRNEANPNVGYGEVFDHMMRSHPQIIIAGELSIRNAYPALLLMNSGHRGFMCTMHANSARMALEEGFYQRITLSGRAVIKRDLVEYLKSAIDLVIQCGPGPDGKRRVLEIWEPARDARRSCWELPQNERARSCRRLCRRDGCRGPRCGPGCGLVGDGVQRGRSALVVVAARLPPRGPRPAAGDSMDPYRRRRRRRRCPGHQSFQLPPGRVWRGDVCHALDVPPHGPHGPFGNRRRQGGNAHPRL